MLTDTDAMVFWMLSLRVAVGEDIARILDMYAEQTASGFGWHTASSDQPQAWN